MRIILASASPRRRELLGTVCREFEIIVEDTDESVDSSCSAKDSVGILAVRKGAAVKEKLFGTAPSEALIISSDTLVELDGVPLGKPADENSAFDMLRSLSGKRHNVHTGVAVHYGDRSVFGIATTGVYFREISDDEIRDYISTGEPMDKAGSYGIQGIGGKFVEKIDGDFDTVVGLSVKLTQKLAYEACGEAVLGEIC